MLENRFFKEHNHYIHLINDISSHAERKKTYHDKEYRAIKTALIFENKAISNVLALRWFVSARNCRSTRASKSSIL